MPSRVLVLVLLALTPLACGGGRGAPVRVRVTAGRGDGIRYAIPNGWHAARHRLTPDLLNPREVLTVATGRLPAGGACAHVPTAALAAMRPADVLVTVQERYGSDATFPPRPPRFALPPATRNDAQDCARNGAITTHLLEFRDGGRGFHAIVAVGRAASAARVRQALEILDSLRVSPRRPVSIDPNTAVPYDDPALGLHLVLSDGWRVYPRRLTAAISARDQLAFGTFRLRQSGPDGNCTPTTALRRRPRDGGFVFIFETIGSRHDYPQLPAKVTRPGPFECFGAATAVQFSDHGRAFQAYVYGPPARVRQAFAILDSLRARPQRVPVRFHAARFSPAPG